MVEERDLGDMAEERDPEDMEEEKVEKDPEGMVVVREEKVLDLAVAKEALLVQDLEAPTTMVQALALAAAAKATTSSTRSSAL